MAERDLIQQLDQAVDAMFAHAAAPATGPYVAELLGIAAALRDLPDEGFRSSLKAEVIRKRNMTPTTERATTKDWIREGFHSVTPYLHPRKASELIDFMKEAFGAEELARHAAPDGRVMHAKVRIGDSIVEMGELDNPAPSALHLYVEDADAVYDRALQAGATSLYSMMDQPYGDREGGVKDPLGNNWYIGTHKGARHVPAGLHAVTPSLTTEGAARLIDFLKQAFGAEEAMVHRSPEDVIVHAKIKIGDSIVEVSEAHGAWKPMPSAFHLYVPDVDSVYRRAIEAGCTSMGEPADRPYGERSGFVTDPAGNTWYIATTIATA